MQGAGRVAFAGIMLLVLGTLNIIYGIGALDNANVFVGDTRLVFDNLNTLGWVLIDLGSGRADRRLLAAGRQCLRSDHRHHRRQRRRDPRAVLDGCRLPVLVAGRLRPVLLGRLGDHHLRRGTRRKSDPRPSTARDSSGPVRTSGRARLLCRRSSRSRARRWPLVDPLVRDDVSLSDLRRACRLRAVERNGARFAQHRDRRHRERQHAALLDREVLRGVVFASSRSACWSSGCRRSRSPSPRARTSLPAGSAWSRPG